MPKKKPTELDLVRELIADMETNFSDMIYDKRTVQYDLYQKLLKLKKLMIIRNDENH